MTHILHITCDYVDEIDENKTPAVFNLVSHTSMFDHTVFSLNRTTRLSMVACSKRRGNLHSLYYFGLPFGIGLRFFLHRTAKRIMDVIAENDIRPDVVHCHKLTFEGLIGYAIARKLDLPLVCSFRGDTDFKLIRFKPSYRKLYQRILHFSNAILYIAPWARAKLERMWPGVAPTHSAVLPNIVNLSFDRSGRDSGQSQKLVTICHLKDYKRKNLLPLIDAANACIDEGLDFSLDIIGGGSNDVVSLLRDYIGRLPHASKISLLGERTREEIEATLGRYAGLVLPSYPETFGMVYLEALQAGIPIMHSENAGVAGYFDEKQVAVAVDPSSSDSIKSGIRAIVENQAELKSNVRQLAESGYMEMFNTEQIVRTYQSVIDAVVVQHKRQNS